jgi:SpoVK/Ycf46/Vps4 family AAA+-type ATPase
MELAAPYDFLAGIIVRAVRRAAADSFGSNDPLDFESLSGVCRAVGTARMGPLAQRLSQPHTRADLVLPKHLLDELNLAAAWMRNRCRVFEQWGFGRRPVLGHGLTALFAGEPGTGKTMATQVLARELGLDLFRVDLSRVMSKYIGDTEKNHAQLFDDARASGAILFFDEPDALFGKRTEVKDAHDSYANLEIGYLLQWMEVHRGTTVLATNRKRDLDEAFIRRFHFILDVPMPRPPERLRIWEATLLKEAERNPGIDVAVLASDYEISGGKIRHSVRSAAFLAAKEGVPMGLRHLKRGLRRELVKTGRVLDSRQRLALDGD